MKYTVRFEGGAELAANLAECSTRVQKGVLLSALTSGGELIAAAASRHAPRSDDPPHVGDHIVVGTSRQRGTGASVAVGPSKSFEPRANIYPRITEVGSIHQAPQPFMRPAFDGTRTQVLGVIRQEIWFELLKRGIGSARTGSGGGLA